MHFFVDEMHFFIKFLTEKQPFFGTYFYCKVWLSQFGTINLIINVRLVRCHCEKRSTFIQYFKVCPTTPCQPFQ